MAEAMMQAGGGSPKLEMYSDSYTGANGSRTYGTIVDTKSTKSKDIAVCMSASTDLSDWYSIMYLQGSNDQTNWVDILSGNKEQLVNTPYRYVRGSHQGKGTFGQTGTSLIVIAE